MDHEGYTIILNRLIRTCRQGDYGFRRCAVHVQDAELKSVFAARGAECARAAADLVRLAQHGGRPADGPTVDRSQRLAAAAPNGWSAVKGMLVGFDDAALLEECQRAERNAMATYGDALEESLPEPLRSLLERQQAAARRSHDCLRKLQLRERHGG